MQFDVNPRRRLVTGVCVLSTKQRSQCGCQVHGGPGSGVCAHGSNVCAAKPIFLLKQTSKRNIHFAKKKKKMMSFKW